MQTEIALKFADIVQIIEGKQVFFPIKGFDGSIALNVAICSEMSRADLDPYKVKAAIIAMLS